MKATGKSMIATFRSAIPGRINLWFVLSLLTLSWSSYADENSTSQWSVSGTNTLRGALYGTSGLRPGSPYPFSGDMYYDEFNLYLHRQDARYSNWRGEVSGVLNANDDYRSADVGIVPERLNLTREDGAGELPYRFELGDHFTYFSYLTQQRSLKGAQLELQPRTSGSGLQHSVVAFTGANEANWRDITPRDDYSSGLSWLVSHRTHGSLSFNAVHNYRDASAKSGSLSRNQFVFSVAGERPLSFAGSEHVFEAEMAWFEGDHNGLSGAASGQDRSDPGYFMQLSGSARDLPWDYEIRLQYYGQDFRPRGAVVTADRKSAEAFSNWRFGSGVLMRLRAQAFADAFETSNMLSTRTYGVNFTGPVMSPLLADVNGSIDLYTQKTFDEAGTTDRRGNTLSVSLSKPLPRGWTGRLGFFAQNIDDKTATNSDAATRQVQLSADHAFSAFGFDGYITPGVVYRELSKGRTDSDDWNPTLAVSLSRGNHSLRADYGGLFQDRVAALSGPDIKTHTFNLDYRFTQKQNTFGVEANLFERNQDGSESTDAYRLSLFWTYEFDHPASQQLAARAAAPLGARLSPARVSATAALGGFVPGSTIEQIGEMLRDAGIVNATDQGGYAVYEVALLRNVARRQRLAIRYQGDELANSGLIVGLDDVGDPATLAQTFERIRKTLIEELGPPTRTFAEGEFSAQFVRDVNAQRLIRLSEWNTLSGTIRFGLPRRLDGQVRLEIQHGRRFPPPRQTLWSIEAVR